MTPNLRATAFLLRSLRQESRLVSHHAMRAGLALTYPPRTQERLYKEEAAGQSYYPRRNAQASKSHRKTRRKRLADLGIDPDKLKSVPPKNAD